MDDIFFILGSGASFDSGLHTYRGVNGYYNNVKHEESPPQILSYYNSDNKEGLSKIWTFLKPLYDSINNDTIYDKFQKLMIRYPSLSIIAQHIKGLTTTYDVLNQVINRFPASFILTQNIDGYASQIENVPIIEIHGNSETMSCIQCYTQYKSDPNNFMCQCCGSPCRPNIVLYREDLPDKKVHQIYKLLKRKYKYILIIGTSLQFPYLREFISKAKQKGAKVIHINPDKDYFSHVRDGEIWFRCDANSGLKTFLNFY
jgi:NAD-dependent SIR2 family protein deacetylase